MQTLLNQESNQHASIQTQAIEHVPWPYNKFSGIIHSTKLSNLIEIYLKAKKVLFCGE